MRAKVCPPGSYVGAFGNKFRTERERRGFTLDDVSNVTKINSRMLKAIEDEHFDLLPGGVFNKGFVRAYAKHLGFNDEESVSEYLVALRQAQVHAQTSAWQPEVPPHLRPEPDRVGRVRVTQPSPEQARAEQVREEQLRQEKPRAEQLAAEAVRVESKPNPPAVKISATRTAPDEVKREVKPEPTHQIKNTQPAPTRESVPAQPAVPQPKYPPADLELGAITPRSDSIPWKVPAVVLGVILVAAVLWNRHSRGVQAEGAPAPHTSESRTAVTNKPAPAPAATAAATPSSLDSNRAASSASASGPQLATKPALSSAPNPAAARERDAAAPGPSSSDRASSDREVTLRKFSSAAPAAKAPPVFTLRIRASETTWISVIADGQPVVQETLIAPASTAIRAAHEITVRVGNASGVSFLLNGKEIPPQGAEAEVKTLTFDSQGLR